MKLKVPTSPANSAAVARAQVSTFGVAVFVVPLAFCTPAFAGTPTSCECLTNFSHPYTTITSAQSQSGGAYVAPDAWHLVFTLFWSNLRAQQRHRTYGATRRGVTQVTPLTVAHARPLEGLFYCSSLLEDPR